MYHSRVGFFPLLNIENLKVIFLIIFLIKQIVLLILRISALNIQLNNNINLEEYLKTSMDELDYEQIIVRDKRSFFRILIDKLIASQMLIDLFYNSNWIIPRTIKSFFLYLGFIYILLLLLYFIMKII